MTGGEQGKKLGIQSAVAELHDPRVPPVMPAEQLPLLPIKEVGKDESAADTVDSVRGVGRPKGAKNRSTAEWKEYILGRYRSPLVALAEIYSRSIQELAVELGHDPANKLTFEKAKELLQLQLQCAKELAPYVHQKQPMAIEGGGAGVMTLVIGAMPDQKAAAAGGDFIDMQLLDVTPTNNQQVSGGFGEKSNETKSNEMQISEENRRAAASQAEDLECAAGGNPCN